MAQIVTITNPLTGQPVQVDQLDHTAQQIDDAISRALPGGAIDIALQKMGLLWENASPASSFAAQTISLDLSGYDYVLVTFRIYGESDVHTYSFGAKGEKIQEDAWMWVRPYWRSYTFSNTGIQFYDCMASSGFDNWEFLTSNISMIPAKIYGIKVPTT